LRSIEDIQGQIKPRRIIRCCGCQRKFWAISTNSEASGVSCIIAGCGGGVCRTTHCGRAGKHINK